VQGVSLSRSGPESMRVRQVAERCEAVLRGCRSPKRAASRPMAEWSLPLLGTSLSARCGLPGDQLAFPRVDKPIAHMSHVVLLGDSTLDNASYTAGGPDVISQVRQLLPPGWKATLSAIDGSTTEEIPEQLESMPDDATHLILSVGGNNAILRADILEKPVASTGEAFHLLSSVAEEFEKQYKQALSTCLSRRLPLAVCTIYHGNFEDDVFRRRAIVALTLFNDAIVRCAAGHQLLVIDLRFVCNAPQDFANPIEPSAIGGAKIARAIVTAVMEPSATKRRSQIATS